MMGGLVCVHAFSDNIIADAEHSYRMVRFRPVTSKKPYRPLGKFSS